MTARYTAFLRALASAFAALLLRAIAGNAIGHDVGPEKKKC
jgi:hypothetical protein